MTQLVSIVVKKIHLFKTRVSNELKLGLGARSFFRARSSSELGEKARKVKSTTFY